MKRFLALVFAVVVVLSLTSCARQSGGKITVAVISNGVSPFWMLGKAGGEKAAKDFDVNFEFRAPAQATVAEQTTYVEDLLAKGVSGISISPIDPPNQTELLNDAAAKVNLITTDSDAPTSNRLCYVGTDNYQAGKAAGEELKKALPDGGKVWVAVGLMDAQNAKDRYNGLNDAVKDTKIKILGVKTDAMDRAKAKANIEDILTSTPDLAALVGLYSYNGPIIADAVKAADKAEKVKIVCFDEEDATLQAISDGLVSATIVQKPFEFGYQSVRILAALAKGEDPQIPENKIVDTGVRVINKDNVDDFKKEMQDILGEEPK